MRLATDGNGRGNWQLSEPGLLPPSLVVVPGGGDGATLFKEVLLETFAIHYRDGRTGNATAVSIASLSISGSSTGIKLVKLSAIYQGLPISVSATWANPLFLLLPMVLNMGNDDNPCIAALAMSHGDGQKGPTASKKDEGVLEGLGRSIGDVFRRQYRVSAVSG